MLEWETVMSAEKWAQATFGEVRLGDQRRTERAVKLAEAMAREPHVSLPKQLGQRKEVKATYRFLQSGQVSYEALMRPHVEQTRAQCQEVPVVLLVQDTTELDYQTHRKTRGLGPIGNGRHQGFLLQTVLAVDPTSGDLLGIAHQEPFVRQPAPTGERYSERVKRERESQVWERAVHAIGAPDPEPEQQVWVHVGDRYSDIYTLFLACRQQQTHFVIRAAQDRCVDERVEEVAPPLKRRKRKAGEPPQAHLFETVRSWAACDEQQLEVPAEHARQARTARVALSYAPLRLLAPDKREHELPSLDVWVVRVWEINAPEGVEPLEWVLLTSLPVESVAQAWERVSWYRRRWIVEDYHQALKTGCGMEERQVQSYEGLQRLLGIVAPNAVRVLLLRTLARQHPERPAVEVLPQEVVQVVALKTGGDATGMSVEQCVKRIAQLGGYQGRRSDGPPGWKTLWHGWLKIQTYSKEFTWLLKFYSNRKLWVQVRCLSWWQYDHHTSRNTGESRCQQDKHKAPTRPRIHPLSLQDAGGRSHVIAPFVRQTSSGPSERFVSFPVLVVKIHQSRGTLRPVKHDYPIRSSKFIRGAT